MSVYIAFAIWPLVTILLFSILGPRRGLIAAMIGGFMFLPYAGISIADGLPPIGKNFVASASAIAVVIALDFNRLTKYRFHWLDIFVLVAWIGWGVSSLVNGLGIQQALLEWWDYAFWVVVPFALGRIYLDSPDAIRDLAIAIVVGTAIYAILAVFEMRFSPQLNQWVYGLSGAWSGFSKRFGGWRPRVFQFHGLGTAMWFAGGAVVAWGLVLSRSRVRILGLPTAAVAVVLSLVSVGCRSAGAMGLMALGILLLVISRLTRSWGWHLVVPTVVVLYIGTAILGPIVPVRSVLSSASEIVFPSKVGSLEFRFTHENALTIHAMKQPVFGWGGWGRNRPETEIAREMTGRRSAVTDGLWIVVLGKYGLIGLVGTYGWMIVPASLAVIQLARLRAGPIGFLVAALSLWSTLFAFDQLLNGFPHVIQGFVAGGLASFAIAAGRIRSRARSTPRSIEASRTLAGPTGGRVRPTVPSLQ